MLVYGLAATLLPSRLARARYGIAQLLVVATVIIMVAANSTITRVWVFWDVKQLFDEWQGAAAKLYYSVAALMAGWCLTAIFNIMWIGSTLDADEAAPSGPTQQEAAA